MHMLPQPAGSTAVFHSFHRGYLYLICYNRYAAAVAALRPNRVASMLAHANTIVQAAQMFEGDGWREYDRAVRLQATATPNEDWGALNLPLYARTFVAAERRRNVCRFCCSRDHASSQCPWGVDTPVSRPLPSAQASLRWSRPPDSTPQICRSWNAGSCRFPTSNISFLPLMFWLTLPAMVQGIAHPHANYTYHMLSFIYSTGSLLGVCSMTPRLG